MSGWVESFNQRAYLVWYAEPPLSPEDIDQSAKMQEENSFSSVRKKTMCEQTTCERMWKWSIYNNW